MATDNRQLINVRNLHDLYPEAYAALAEDDTLGLSVEDYYEEHTDVLFFVHAGELYLRSYDEYTLSVWRDGEWVEVEFDAIDE